MPALNLEGCGARNDNDNDDDHDNDDVVDDGVVGHGTSNHEIHSSHQFGCCSLNGKLLLLLLSFSLNL